MYDLLGGVPVVCGGYFSDGETSDECKTYNFTSREWMVSAKMPRVVCPAYT